MGTLAFEENSRFEYGACPARGIVLVKEVQTEKCVSWSLIEKNVQFSSVLN